MESNVIADVVLELIGPVSASGDSAIDNQRYHNLKKLEDVCDLLHEKIFYASLDKDSELYSMQQVGAEANSYLKSEYKWLCDVYKEEPNGEARYSAESITPVNVNDTARRLQCTEVMLTEFDTFFDGVISREFLECIRIALRRSLAIDRIELANAEMDGERNEIQN